MPPSGSRTVPAFGKDFDLISSLLAVVAIADTAHDRPAERFEFDATA